jgi:protoheme IX farnesyltransferase
VLLVMLGGYLMAGGANAVNMYIDRDIDDVMARTRLRPIPERPHARPRRCSRSASLRDARHVDARALRERAHGRARAGGFYFYVFIYTRWLKRTSPQNIVIGGAAGAFPPLVGWAAVTGTLDLTALCLFLIVFYWTPPHFWALALLKQVDYGRAKVPMAPLVWGERETMWQMVWYTVILLVLTVLPVLYGAFGLFYLVSALVLGGCCSCGACSRCSGPRRSRSRGRAGVVGVQVLAAVSGAALRGDGRGPGARRVRAPRRPRPATGACARLARDFRRPSRSRDSPCVPLVRPYRTRLAVAFVFLVIAAAAGLVFPAVMRFLLDAAFEQKDRSGARSHRDHPACRLRRAGSSRTSCRSTC